ncbi:MAG: transglycosylase family protein [Streptosporangiaceae bacterium]
MPDPDSLHIGQVLTEPDDPAVPGWLQSAAGAAMGSVVLTSSAPAVEAGGDVSTEGMAAFEACVIQRESGGNPAIVNQSSGAGGLFQFLPSTWDNYDGYPNAQSAPVSVQEAYFAIEYAADGTSPWAPYDGC